MSHSWVTLGVSCPACGKAFEVEFHTYAEVDEEDGKEVHCPQCKAKLIAEVVKYAVAEVVARRQEEART